MLKCGRSQNKNDEITVEHYGRIDVFIATIDNQLWELNNKFNEYTVELLVLSTILDRRDGFTFNIDHLCKVEKEISIIIILQNMS